MRQKTYNPFFYHAFLSYAMRGKIKKYPTSNK